MWSGYDRLTGDVLFLKTSLTDNALAASQKKLLYSVLCVTYHFWITKYCSTDIDGYFTGFIACYMHWSGRRWICVLERKDKKDQYLILERYLDRWVPPTLKIIWIKMRNFRADKLQMHLPTYVNKILHRYIKLHCIKYHPWLNREIHHGIETILEI